MIEYIVNYQNNFISSFLFNKNFPILLEKGINVANLLNSQVFSLSFDYDDWPSSHTDQETYLRGYNHSIFQLRYHYKTIFPDINALEEDLSDGDPQQLDSSKIYKITYSINILPQIGEYVILNQNHGREEKEFVNSDCNLMGLICDTEELEIFDTRSIGHLVEFKWNAYAFKHHIFGCCMHGFYITMFIIYINVVYINYSEEVNKDQLLWTILILLGIIYPAIYDWTQMAR